jgi:site-specific recombinase XerD
MQNIEESVLKTLELIENLNTVSTYRRSLDYFLQSLEISPKEDVSNLSLSHFIHFVKWIAEKDLSKSAKKLHVCAMKKLVNYLVVNDLLEYSYADNEKVKQVVKLYVGNTSSFVPKVPYVGDAEKMIETVLQNNSYVPARQRNIALILFLATSGCRRSEAANLKVADVDLETCSARIYGGKGDKDRQVIISRQTCKAIRHYWVKRKSAKENPTAPAFARHDKQSKWRDGLTPMTPQAIYTLVKRVSKSAGVEFSPHSFRHDVATKLARINPQLAKEQLGHVSEVTTGKYLHFTQEELSLAIKEIFQ